MLVELHVENFVLIERLTLALGPGLSVFTGETGAGKSLLIDAVTAALGGRAGADMIRSGADRAVVEAIFDCDPGGLARARLVELGLDGGDGTLVLTRELYRHGRHLTRINRRPAPLSAVREIAALLCDVHGQHEHHSLLQPGKPLALVDGFGGDRLAGASRVVGAVWTELVRCRAELADLGGVPAWVSDANPPGPRAAGAEPVARRLDLLRYQAGEIDAARLQPGEDAERERERARLRHAERLARGVQTAYELLYEGASDERLAAADLCGQAGRELADLARFDPGLQGLADAVEAAAVQIEEAARSLRGYLDRLDTDPKALQAVEDRLHLIGELRRKYGATIQEVLAYREQVAAELDRLERADELAAALRRREAALIAEHAAACAELSRLRSQAAAELTARVGRELAELGLERAELLFVVEPAGHADGDGADRVSILFTANPGDPPRPLVRVASGGELSRIMLALESVISRLDDVPCLIFDEVDAGVSGQAAHRVAEKLARLGGARQVLCVSHLPQMASLGDQHFRIVKEVNDGSTQTRIERLDPAGRVQELARLLGGSDAAPVAAQHARELIGYGESRRAQLRQAN